jgi:hypothetical protein
MDQRLAILQKLREDYFLECFELLSLDERDEN